MARMCGRGGWRNQSLRGLSSSAFTSPGGETGISAAEVNQATQVKSSPRRRYVKKNIGYSYISSSSYINTASSSLPSPFNIIDLFPVHSVRHRARIDLELDRTRKTGRKLASWISDIRTVSSAAGSSPNSELVAAADRILSTFQARAFDIPVSTSGTTASGAMVTEKAAVAHSLVSTIEELMEFLGVVEEVVAARDTGPAGAGGGSSSRITGGGPSPRVASPYLFVDLEGINLSRHGSISIITIFVQPRSHVYLIDVHTLGPAAFATPSSSNTTSGTDFSSFTAATISTATATATTTSTPTTLKSILESPSICKVFFDVRNDSDALFAHFAISLSGVEDVQLMENAARMPGGRRFLHGLEKCIDRDLPLSILSPSARREWKNVKEQGVRLFHPSRGGSYEVFNERPLREEMVRYCVNDVVFLPPLRDRYWGGLGEEWKGKVAGEARRRVLESQQRGYEPHGRDKALGPWERELR